MLIYEYSTIKIFLTFFHIERFISEKLNVKTELTFYFKYVHCTYIPIFRNVIPLRITLGRHQLNKKKKIWNFPENKHNTDENVHRFALGAIRGEQRKRETKREKKGGEKERKRE